MSKYFNAENQTEVLEDFKAYLQPLKGKPGLLMQALHHAQDSLGFVPPEVQELIAKEMRIPLSDIYGVVTFYSRFTMVPKGEHNVSVCMGTACYVKGAEKLLEEVEKVVGTKAGTTSEDGKVSVTTTRCVGACSMAPVVIDGETVSGRLKPKDVVKLLEHLKHDDNAMQEAQDFLAQEA